MFFFFLLYSSYGTALILKPYPPIAPISEKQCTEFGVKWHEYVSNLGEVFDQCHFKDNADLLSDTDRYYRIRVKSYACESKTSGYGDCHTMPSCKTKMDNWYHALSHDLSEEIFKCKQKVSYSLSREQEYQETLERISQSLSGFEGYSGEYQELHTLNKNLNSAAYRAGVASSTSEFLSNIALNKLFNIYQSAMNDFNRSMYKATGDKSVFRYDEEKIKSITTLASCYKANNAIKDLTNCMEKVTDFNKSARKDADSLLEDF